MAKLLDGIATEEIACSTSRNRPALDHFGIRPQQVTHSALLRDFSKSVDLLQIVDLLDIGRQSTVHAEDLIIHNGSNGKVVEDIGERSPNIK